MLFRSVIEGRAWSGHGAIERVEVSEDGGKSWHDAMLSESAPEFAWRGWTFRWNATPGKHVLSCRATDASGRTQPDAGSWNEGGYCNNAVQRVRVVVTSRASSPAR